LFKDYKVAITNANNNNKNIQTIYINSPYIYPSQISINSNVLYDVYSKSEKRKTQKKINKYITSL
jgi:hypothetical protein